MRNVKITYQYDGSKYYGFQRQKNKDTVQGDIEKLIFNRFNQKVNMISSGRTDKGVHALEQVSNFMISKNIPLFAIKNQINKTLLGKVKVLDIEEIYDSFNSRFDAKSRTYIYILKKESKITPFEVNYVSPISYDIDVERLKLILKPIIGRHNFIGFSKKDSALRNPVREIYDINCYYNENEEKYYIEIRGNSFLKTMIRIIIGSALAIYSNEKDINYIISKLENPNECDNKIIAPSNGLYLYEIEY